MQRVDVRGEPSRHWSVIGANRGIAATEVAGGGVMTCPAWPAEADQLMTRDRGAGWRLVRAAGPVLHREGTYFLTRRADVVAALHDPALASIGKLPQPDGAVPFTAAHRKIMERLFNPTASRKWTEGPFRERIAIRIDELAARGGCDGMADMAWPAWVDLFLVMIEETTGTDGTFDMVTAIRRGPTTGLLARAVAETSSIEEACGIAQLSAQGMRSVVADIGSCLYRLAANPGLGETLRDDTSRRKRFIEEVLRLDSASSTVIRAAVGPIDVAGVTIPAGATVVLCTGAANREDSDELRLSGKSQPHLAFSSGPDACRGAYLARAAMNVVVHEWVMRIPDAQLPDGYVPQIWYPERRLPFSPFALRELPLRWAAATGGTP